MEDFVTGRYEVRRVTIDDVIKFVMPYITVPEDRGTTSLVCRRWYRLDAETREHITMALCYTAKPDRLSGRFPNLRSIKLKGKPRAAMYNLIPEDWGGYATPWVNDIAASFRQLKSLHFRRMIVSDLDLDVLAQARQDDLEVLNLDRCSGFSTDGLFSIARHCRKIKSLLMEKSSIVDKDGEWLHELATNNKSLEVLNFYMTELVKVSIQDLEQIATNCSSLVSVKISDCELQDLGGFFCAASALEEFCGGSINEETDQPDKYLNMAFPPKICRLGMSCMGRNQMPMTFPLAAQLTKLNLRYALLDTEDYCTLIPKCPNLEVLETRNVIGDRGLEVLACHCKRLNRLRIERGANEQGMEDEEGLVSQRGLIALAQGCQELQHLAVYVSEITNESLENIGTHLKNLYDFRLALLDREERVTDFPVDNGVQALLRGCQKLRRLALYLRPGGLTDVGMDYIGQYSPNLRWILLGYVGKSDEGLLGFSRGCPNLQKLEMTGCCFSEHAIATAVKRLSSLRYLWVHGYRASEAGQDLLDMARPFWNIELIPSRRVQVSGQFGESKELEHPAHILAYYSLAGQRKDFPSTVIPFGPYR